MMRIVVGQQFSKAGSYPGRFTAARKARVRVGSVDSRSIAYHFAAATLFLATLFAALPKAQAQSSISRIQATYDIYLSGINLGDFRFKSSFSGSKYTLTGHTNIEPPIISMFFKWQGKVYSTGTISGAKPTPAAYSFRYTSSEKSGSMKMAFAGGSVSKVEARPVKKKKSKAYIPLRAEDLRNVMDPMSALMMFQRKSKSLRQACDQKIPVFDGNQRFDLTFSYKGMARLKSSDTGGYSGPAVVCKVRYTPISGYKTTAKATNYMAKTDKIDVWLIPVPRTDIFVPYRIHLPTPAGMASVRPRNFQVRHQSGRRVALIKN